LLKKFPNSSNLLLYTQQSATGSSHMLDISNPNFSTMFNVYFNIRLLFSICLDLPNDQTCVFSLHNFVRVLWSPSLRSSVAEYNYIRRISWHLRCSGQR